MTRLHLLALGLAASGCVVTTIEGPGEPPRVAAPPPALEPAKVTVEQSALPNEPESVAARHMLVAYRGATRASPVVTRTKEDARKRADEALARARKGDAFEDLVKEYSDEPGAAERGGDLGRFKRNMMVKPFADAAFKLNPGEVSEVVETQFGFHVIQRTE